MGHVTNQYMSLDGNGQLHAPSLRFEGLMRSCHYLVSVLFSPPSLHAKEMKLFYPSSIHFSVPQEKTIVMIGKTAGQLNTTALAVNYAHTLYTYIRFFVAPYACLLSRLTTKCCVL